MNMETINKQLNPFILNVIKNDNQIKALNKCLDDLFRLNIPKYEISTEGEFIVENNDRFNELVSKIHEQIELRQQQIIHFYN